MSDLHTANLLSTLPRVLKEDKTFFALAKVTADQLMKTIEQLHLVTIYAAIDNLPEAILDVLAYDFKVDWWDYNFTLEQKRQTLKDSFLVHKFLGTKYAVERAISAIYPETTVREWFETGGDPYTFELLIHITEPLTDLDGHAKVLKLAEFYKNLRSHLVGTEYWLEPKAEAPLRMGGSYGMIVTIPVPEAT